MKHDPIKDNATGQGGVVDTAYPSPGNSSSHSLRERRLLAVLATCEETSRHDLDRMAGYLRHHEGNIQPNDLNEWMRVVRNLSANTAIERPEEYGRSLSGLLKLLPHSARILEHLSTTEVGPIGFSPQQVREEVLKSKLILADAAWRGRIDQAEEHGYFVGQIEFLLDFCGVLAQPEKDPSKWENSEHAKLQTDFDLYLRKAQITFGSSGLGSSEQSAEDYLWQRALLTFGDYLLSNSSNSSFLTDPPSNWDSWKRLLRGDDGKRAYLKALWDQLDAEAAIEPQLKEIIDTATDLEPWRSAKGADLANAAKASTKRPDVVIYINGIALGVLELKRSTVSVAEGIRQNLDNQKKEFIQPFFSTLQWVMAGNDTEGLRYATIETPEKYYLRWVEDTGPYAGEPNLLDRHLLQVCRKARLLELIHDFIVFDAGTKKLCRQNQYFGVKAAQEFIQRREGGIIWHTQGSGKSLTMVWLAKWIRENREGSRVLIITDRTELDEQIEKVFKGVHEQIYRTTSGNDLIEKLNGTEESLLCSLVHKFGCKGDNENDEGTKEFIAAIQKLPPDFKAKGDIHVFVDECHRTQSGDLHKAMKALLPNAIFIGFTGTPLLKADKQKSIEVFGRYIHTYKFDQAVREGVVLDLRYEARDIDQSITSQKKIDEWFEANTKGLNDLAKAQLKQRWGTMQTVLSSQDRLSKIVADILMDMATKPRLMDGHGNAMLVAGSIYEACKFYELFAKTGLKGKCAIVTSYAPSVADTKGETTGAGDTDNLIKYGVYAQMLADWFNEPAEKAKGGGTLGHQ